MTSRQLDPWGNVGYKTGVVAGAVADRVGRKRMMGRATALYAVLGTAP